jgi:phosphoribosylformylglycinamidine (FGAM) synthase-like enzyme
MHAVAEAARNVAASGARPIAATNCLNFGSPEKPEVMWQFSQAIDGLGEACTALATPITGGNVSFYNETLGKSIYPTPVIGILGILDDASKVLKIAFRNEGDIIVLLNGANSSGAGQHTTAPSARRREFSSSEYSKTIAGIVAGEPPSIELGAEKWLIDCLVALASANTIESAHDLSDGGAAVALAESCFASSADQPSNCHPERSPRSEGSAFSSLGATVTLPENASAEYALFGESGARAIVSVSPTKLAALRATARQYGVGAHEIGKVTSDNSLRIEYKGHTVVQSEVPFLYDVWAHSLERTLVTA